MLLLLVLLLLLLLLLVVLRSSHRSQCLRPRCDLTLRVGQGCSCCSCHCCYLSPDC